MGFKKIAVLVVLMLAFAAAPAAQAFDVGALIGGNWASQNISPAPANNPNAAAAGFGFGAYSNWTLVPLILDLELDVLYLNNASSNSTANSTSNFSSLNIPLIARFSGLPIIAPGVGLMWSDFLGSIHSSTAGTAGPDVTFSNAGLNTSNLSLVLSLGAKYAIGGGLNVVGEVNYDLGLSDLNNPAVTGASNKLNNFMILAGVSFGL